MSTSLIFQACLQGLADEYLNRLDAKATTHQLIQDEVDKHQKTRLAVDKVREFLSEPESMRELTEQMEIHLESEINILLERKS